MSYRTIGSVKLIFREEQVDEKRFICEFGDSPYSKESIIKVWQKRYGKVFHNKSVEIETIYDEKQKKPEPIEEKVWEAKKSSKEKKSVPQYGKIAKGVRTGMRRRYS